MDLRHKLPLITTAVIIALITGTRFISSVFTNDIGGVDPRITLPPKSGAGNTRATTTSGSPGICQCLGRRGGTHRGTHT